MENRAPKSLDELLEAFRQSGGAEELAARYSDVPCPQDDELRHLGSDRCSAARDRELRWHLVYCDGCFLRAVRLGGVSSREELEA